MSNRQQQAKAALLLSLHKSGTLLVLPNVWNPVGARILEAKGFPAVATASAAVSASLGFEDGEQIQRSTLTWILSHIARSVTVPVTADIESGYGASLQELEQTIREAIAAGVVGINIEDSVGTEGELRPIADQCERIARIRQVSEEEGMHLVINARIDSFLSARCATREAKMEEAVIRARSYAIAGADCIYPIGPGDIETVRELRRRIAAPLNILARPTSASLSALQEIGINRVSFGPFLFRSCMRTFVDIVDGISAGTNLASLGEQMLTANDLKPYLIHHKEEVFR